MPTEATNLTALLYNATLERLERLRLQSRTRRTNRGRGEHLASKGGTSIEFHDYRDYAPGDDTRFVDWNLFARLHRPYLKQFRREEERHIVALLDTSRSMDFEGKFALAQRLAAACAVLALHNLEPFSLYASNRWPERSAHGQAETTEGADDKPARAADHLGPLRGRVSLRRALRFVEGLAPAGAVRLETAVDSLLRRHRGRGIVLLISDFLTPTDLSRAFNGLYAAGLEVWGLQILAPSEIDPAIRGDLRLLDAETGETLDVSGAAGLLSIYQEQRADREERLRDACTRSGGRFLSVSADAPLEWLLFDLLRRQGWLA